MKLNKKVDNNLFSIAGTWKAVSDQFINASTNGEHTTSYGDINLPGTNGQSIILDGWSYNGFSNSGTITQINSSLLVIQPDGTLKLQTSKYISNVSTNGNWFPIIADFNGDGISDIFLAAHNESPTIGASSTVYLSDKAGSYNKLVLGDSVTAHQPNLVYVNGIPTVFVSPFTSGPWIYQFNKNTQTFDINKINVGTATNPTNSPSSVYGDSNAEGDFLGNGQLEYVGGDLILAPDITSIPKNYWGFIKVYPLDSNLQIQSNSVANLTPYYSDPKFSGYFGNYSFTAATANQNAILEPRLFTDDFNHDGKLDIVGISGIWSGNHGWQKSVLQMFQNQGNFNFKDVTDSLNSGYDQNSNPDYTLQITDIDKSGINSFLLGQGDGDVTGKNGNFLLLNDGTGHLYSALHAEFIDWTKSINSYLYNSNDPVLYNSNGKKYYFGSGNYDGQIYNFRAYLNQQGNINYEAHINAWDTNNPDYQVNVRKADIFINVPVNINVDTDFTDNITISDRNNSVLMRTWAGNDTFYDTNANSQAAHIDGGLGNNTSIYTDASNAYAIIINKNSIEVKHNRIDAAPNVDDTLVNIQSIKFADLSLDFSMFTKTAALSSSQISSLVELYVASFNRAPDSVGLDYWGSRLSDGMSLQDIAKSFFVQPETVAAYPTNMPTSDFVTKVYNNVLSRGPDAGGLNYWVGELNNGHVTKDSFLLAIINGAMAPTGSAVDRQTLANKEAVGEHYAIYQGLNNSTNWAKDVMSGVTDQMATVTAANAKADGYAAIAANPATSDLVVKLVGVAV